MLGGGMRQAGILAAAGLHALEHHVERLADDHAHARRLAEGLAALGFAVDTPPETNMVLFRVEDTAAFLRATRARDLRIDPMEPGRFRAVTHLMRRVERKVDIAARHRYDHRRHGRHGSAVISDRGGRPRLQLRVGW